MRTDPRARIAAFVIATGLLSAVALLFSPPAFVSYGKAGVVADREVRAPHSTAFSSEVLSQIERDKAAAAVQRVYVIDPAVTVTSSAHLQAALTGIGTISAVANASPDDFLLSLDEGSALGDALRPLLDANVQIYACREEQSQIEDAFMRLTRPSGAS